MNESKICTCPSGDGSLRWPCPKHPAVEQAGGDERAAFEVWIHTFDLPPQLDGEIFVDERYPEADCFGQFVYDDHSTQRCWAAWQARAALAQPSPALPPFAEKVLAKLRRFYDCASDFESGGVDIGRHWVDLLTQLGLLNRVQRSPALWEISQQGEDLLGMPQPSPAQAEAERPEVVARVVHSNPVVLGQCGPLNANDELMTVAQHAASVARWAEMFNRVEQQRDAALAEVERLRESKGDPVGSLEKCMKVMYERDEHAKRLEAALARVAELEKQEPVATVAKVPGEDWNSLDFHRDLQHMQPGTKLYAAHVAQAQQLHDLDKQCRDDVARALGLRPNQERGFAWSYLLASIKSCVKASGDSAQAQHSVPEGWKLVPVEPTEDVLEAIHNGGYVGDDQELRWFYQSILAAAPAPGGE